MWASNLRLATQFSADIWKAVEDVHTHHKMFRRNTFATMVSVTRARQATCWLDQSITMDRDNDTAGWTMPTGTSMSVLARRSATIMATRLHACPPSHTTMTGLTVAYIHQDFPVPEMRAERNRASVGVADSVTACSNLTSNCAIQV